MKTLFEVRKEGKDEKFANITDAVESLITASVPLQIATDRTDSGQPSHFLSRKILLFLGQRYISAIFLFLLHSWPMQSQEQKKAQHTFQLLFTFLHFFCQCNIFDGEKAGCSCNSVKCLNSQNFATFGSVAPNSLLKTCTRACCEFSI